MNDILGKLLGIAILGFFGYLLIKSGLIWLLLLALAFGAYLTAKKPLKNYQTCPNCNKPYDANADFHKLTGVCYDCICNNETLLLAALDINIQHKHIAGKDSRLYHYYLQSNAWKTKRHKLLEKTHNRCSRCNSSANLHLHHLTYARLGSELDDDLRVLCKNCHEYAHDSTF